MPGLELAVLGATGAGKHRDFSARLPQSPGGNQGRMEEEWEGEKQREPRWLLSPGTPGAGRGAGWGAGTQSPGEGRGEDAEPKAGKEMGGTGRLMGGAGVRQRGSQRSLLPELGHRDQGWEQRLAQSSAGRRGVCRQDGCQIQRESWPDWRRGAALRTKRVQGLRAG